MQHFLELEYMKEKIMIEQNGRIKHTALTSYIIVIRAGSMFNNIFWYGKVQSARESTPISKLPALIQYFYDKKNSRTLLDSTRDSKPRHKKSGVAYVYHSNIHKQHSHLKQHTQVFKVLTRCGRSGTVSVSAPSWCWYCHCSLDCSGYKVWLVNWLCRCNRS